MVQAIVGLVRIITANDTDISRQAMHQYSLAALVKMYFRLRRHYLPDWPAERHGQAIVSFLAQIPAPAGDASSPLAKNSRPSRI